MIQQGDTHVQARVLWDTATTTHWSSAKPSSTFYLSIPQTQRNGPHWYTFSISKNMSIYTSTKPKGGPSFQNFRNVKIKFKISLFFWRWGCPVVGSSIHPPLPSLSCPSPPETEPGSFPLFWVGKTSKQENTDMQTLQVQLSKDCGAGRMKLTWHLKHISQWLKFLTNKGAANHYFLLSAQQEVLQDLVHIRRVFFSTKIIKYGR